MVANLPTTAAVFVGRDAELAHIRRLLSDPACRLLTLAGPGGIGKTRLAVEVLRLLADGLSNAEIAERLYLSTGTVKAHTRSIYSKLAVNNR